MLLTNIHTKTHPCVVHAPDYQKNPWWPKLLNIYCQEPQSVYANHQDLEIITWNNKPPGPFEKSLELRGLAYHRLGSEIVNWSNYYKLRLNVEAISKMTCKYVMGCDAHDVILMRSPAEIVKRFEAMQVPLVFNCEQYFYPDMPEPVIQGWKTYEQSIGSGRYRFLNAGAWIGEREFCLKFFEEVDKIRVYDLCDCEKYQYLKKDSIGCDQSSLHEAFQRYPQVKLDYECSIFQNIARINEGDLSLTLV